MDTFQGYHEPTRAISAEITALTGISAETVTGHALDPEAVGAFVAPAVIVLAHNAAPTGASPSAFTPTSPPRLGAAP